MSADSAARRAATDARTCPANHRRDNHTQMVMDGRPGPRSCQFGVYADGIVAVRGGSTEVLTIKQVRSLELEYSDDGVGCTGDGRRVANVGAGEITRRPR